MKNDKIALYEIRHSLHIYIKCSYEMRSSSIHSNTQLYHQLSEINYIWGALSNYNWSECPFNLSLMCCLGAKQLEPNTYFKLNIHFRIYEYRIKYKLAGNKMRISHNRNLWHALKTIFLVSFLSSPWTIFFFMQSAGTSKWCAHTQTKYLNRK